MDLNQKTAQSNKYFLIIVIIFALVLGFFVGTFFPRNTSNTAKTTLASSKLEEVFNVLSKQSYYRDRLSTEEAQNSSIKGLVEGLEDPYTRYYNIQEYKQYKETFAGNIYGIGVELENDTKGTKIVAVTEGSPAEKAGIKAGDKLIKIDNVDVSDKSAFEVASLVRGAVGTKVKIEVTRQNENKSFDITRDKIYTKSSSFSKIEDSGLCQIRIRRFTEDSEDLWKKNWDESVSQYLSSNCTGLIIDIRNNGGGYVNAAKYAIEEFVADGTTIFGEKRDGAFSGVLSNRDAKSRAGTSEYGTAGRLRNVKVTILIDAGSASASEIFAGSLQQLGRAKLIGLSTVGKGTQQERKEFSDGSALIFTVANWTLPNSSVIDANYPIKPDIAVIDSDLNDGKDEVLQKALNSLQ